MSSVCRWSVLAGRLTPAPAHLSSMFRSILSSLALAAAIIAALFAADPHEQRRQTARLTQIMTQPLKPAAKPGTSAPMPAHPQRSNPVREPVESRATRVELEPAGLSVPSAPGVPLRLSHLPEPPARRPQFKAAREATPLILVGKAAAAASVSKRRRDRVRAHRGRLRKSAQRRASRRLVRISRRRRMAGRRARHLPTIRYLTAPPARVQWR